MQKARKFIRIATTWILVGFALTILASVVGEFFIELAKEQGLYENPSAKVASMMSLLAEIVRSWWFILALGVFLGAVVALWSDYFLRRADAPANRRIGPS